MTTRQMSSSTKVKWSRMGTPITRTDPTDPELAALGVLPSCAKYSSALILTQGFASAGLAAYWAADLADFARISYTGLLSA